MASSDTLNIALSDSLVYARLAALLALHRQHEPGVRIRLREVPLKEQMCGLDDGTFDAGFCQSVCVPQGISATPIWRDALAVGVARRHPLLAHQSVPIGLVAGCPWVTLDARVWAGYREQVEQFLAAAGASPSSTIEVQSFDLMMTLVAAGYGVCLVPAARVEQYHPIGVIGRPLADQPAELTTYLLHKSDVSSVLLDRFAESIQARPN